MSINQGGEPAVEIVSQLRRVVPSVSQSLVVGRAVQPIGSMDLLNARVPGFEDVTEQPDWGDNGFSGRKSDVRVVRFDRRPEPETAV